MATQAPNPGQLPLLYGGLEALNANQHGKMKYRKAFDLPQVGTMHAVPLTVEEFPIAQRYYPIIFSTGDNPVPLALLGLNEGVNTFFEADGKPMDGTFYIPAYLRRYPFLLAKIRQDSDELTLCFDPTSGALAEDGDGLAVFDGDQPSEATKGVLAFCEIGRAHV